MMKAVNSAVHDHLSVQRAAIEFNVQRSTLGDRISGRVLPGAVNGRAKYLSDEEEQELARFLMRCASIGYPRSRKQVIAIVQRSCRSRGMKVHVTHGWWEAFCHRYPAITSRITAPMSYARARATDGEVISQYFDMLEHALIVNKLLDRPSQIFNIDETGMPLDPAPPKGVGRVGAKNPVAVSSPRLQPLAALVQKGTAFSPYSLGPENSLPRYDKGGSPWHPLLFVFQGLD